VVAFVWFFHCVNVRVDECVNGWGEWVMGQYGGALWWGMLDTNDGIYGHCDALCGWCIHLVLCMCMEYTFHVA